MTIVSAVLAVAAASASASSAPKIQTDGFGDWSQTWRVHPGEIVFGSYYCVKSRHYWRYNGTHANANGRLFLDACIPDCARDGHFVNASIAFYAVRSHIGPGKYFSRFKMTWGSHHRFFWISSHGQILWPGA